jgi:hypothetical protein
LSQLLGETHRIHQPSASTVSDLNQKIYGKIEEWRQQPLVTVSPY